MIKILTLICLILSTPSFAGWYGGASLGVLESAKESPVETKFADIGFRERIDALVPFLVYGAEVGAWNDDTVNQGRSSALYGSLRLGVEARNVLMLRITTGPSIITATDSYLGLPFEFMEEFYLGLDGRNCINIGASYRHFSNAGFSRINTGRDFVGFEIELKY
jgi:hypothetical protein